MQKALFGREARGLEEGLEALADALERHLDLRALHRALGLTGRAFPASPTEAICCKLMFKPYSATAMRNRRRAHRCTP